MRSQTVFCLLFLSVIVGAQGCGQKTLPAVVDSKEQESQKKSEKKTTVDDSRKRWEHEQGFIVLDDSGKWFETNYKDMPRQGGKPHEFIEVRRTPEFIELRDPLRALTVRLMDTAFEVHWDAQGIEKPFIKLYQGGWKK